MREMQLGCFRYLRLYNFVVENLRLCFFGWKFKIRYAEAIFFLYKKLDDALPSRVKHPDPNGGDDHGWVF